MKFSIIVPVYNTEDYLRECLDSILTQTEESWECLCINDGSTDGSGRICDEYAFKDSRFRVIHQENKGLTATRNVGLRLAQGDYVAFLDCDDARREDWLERAREVLDNCEADIIRMSYSLWYGEKFTPRCDKCDVTIRKYEGKQELFNWSWNVLSRTAYVWLLFVRRQILEGFQFEERRIYREDMISSFHLLLRAKNLVQFDYPGCLYRMRPGSMMASKVRVDELIGYWEEYLKLIISQKDKLCSFALWEKAICEFSIAVFGSTRNWIVWRNNVELEKFENVAITINKFCEAGMLQLRFIPRVWRGFFKFYYKTRLMGPFICYIQFAIFAVKIRKKIFKH